MKKYSLDDVLKAREERSQFHEYLINRFNLPLVSVKVNYPGINKTNNVSLGIIKIFDDFLSKMYDEKIEYKVFETGGDGPDLTIVIHEDEELLKKKMIEVEDTHFLGRCADIDVIGKSKKILSRKDFNMPPRRCFLCDDDAKVCGRLRRHKEDELTQFLNFRYKEYLENFYE